MAKIRSEGRRISLVSESERTIKGVGSKGDGGVKMLRSSSKNLEGGGISVSTSSMPSENWNCHSVCHNIPKLAEHKI